MNIFIAIIMMAIASYIDLKEKIVPDWLSGGGALIGLALSALMPNIHDAPNHIMGFLSGLGNCCLIVFFMCWYANLTERLLGHDTLGGGDIKIMGALATMLNFKIIICILLLAPIFGLINFAIERMRYEIYGLPYCPAIFMATIFSAVFNREIIGFVL